MKKANPLIASILLVVICASAVSIEHDLVMGFETLSSFFASVFGLFALMLVALLRAPEGYEDENGRCVRFSQLIPRLARERPQR